MQRVVSFLLVLTLALTFAPALFALSTTKTVNCAAEGELAAWLSDNSEVLDTIEELIVTGVLDDGDLLALSEARFSFTQLKNLDLSGVTGGVSALPDYFWFFSISSFALETVLLPDCITTIGHYAFLNCTTLQSITMTKVTTIGEQAFLNCAALQSITMTEVTSIGNYAFSKCAQLQSITMPKVTTIGYYAFSYCAALRLVYVGGQTVTTDMATFQDIPDDALLLYGGAEPTGSEDENIIFYRYPLSLSAKVGGSVTLGEGLSGYTGTELSFAWHKGSSSLGAGLTRTLSDLTADDAGGYHLRVTIDGVAYSLPVVTLSVLGSDPTPPPKPPVGGSGGNETWPSLPPPAASEEKANPGMGGR